LLYPPLYSPDLNLIEKALAELKQLLHSAKARLPRLDRSV
jgi:transposase